MAGSDHHVKRVGREMLLSEWLHFPQGFDVNLVRYVYPTGAPNTGVSDAMWGYKRGYKTAMRSLEASIHAGFKASLERFHRPVNTRVSNS